MKINVLFYGSLIEITGENSLIVENVKDIRDLHQKIRNEYPELSKKNYAISVNKILSNNNIDLKNNDEVAFLPPFAGG